MLVEHHIDAALGWLGRLHPGWQILTRNRLMEVQTEGL